MEYFANATVYSSYLFLLLANVSGILRFKALRKNERWYVYYLIYTSMIEAASTLSVKLFHAKDTSAVYPFYIGGVFSILAYLYIVKLKFPKIWALLIPAIGILYLFIHQYLNEINHDHIKVISNVIIFVLAGVILLQEIRKTNSDNRFLPVDAFIFLYYSVSTFIFILHHQLGNMEINQAFLLWSINNVLTCILYLSFTYTFLKLKK